MSVLKKKKAVKITIIIISIPIFLVIAGVGLVLFSSWDDLVWSSSKRPVVAPITIDSTELSGYGADALYLVEMIEQIHPIFIIEDYLPDNYVAVRDEFLESAKNFTSRQEFVFAAYRFVTLLQDGHMSGANLFMDPVYFVESLDVQWEVWDGRLFLVDETGRTTTEVVAIGGIRPAQVWEVIDTYTFSENEIYQMWIHAVYSTYGVILELAEVEMADSQVTLTLNNLDEISTLDVELIMADDLEEDEQEADISVEEMFEEWRLLLLEEHGFVIRHEVLDDDIFFIDLRGFIDGDHITETVAHIEQAMDDGVRKFIIDLRGNPGGNSHAGARLLHAMGISLPTSGSVQRFSPPMMRTIRAVAPLSMSVPASILDIFADGMHTSPTTATAANPNNVFVSVLTDHDTYSSAMMMAEWIQDGDLGNIIGAPSRNAPTSFGNMALVDLPYSGLTLRVSGSLFLRSDANADQTTLWPDIDVDPADAKDVALDFLRDLE